MTGRPVDESLPTNSRTVADAEVLSPNGLHPDAAATTSEANNWNGQTLRDRILRPQTLISFGIALAVVVFVFTRFDLNLGSVLTEMSHANPLYLAIGFAAYYGAFLLRAARWQSLLRSAKIEPGPEESMPRLPGLTSIFVLSWFANCLVPAKLGDAYRAFLLKQRAKTSFTGTLGTIFAERLVDLITLAGLLVASGFVVFGRHLPARVTDWMFLAVALGVLLLLSLALVFRFRHHLRGRVPHRVRHHYVRVEEGIFGSFGRIPTLLALTLVIWVLEGVRLYFVSLAVGAGLTVAAAVFVALLASLLTVIPVTPAGLGFVELGVVGTLTLLGIMQQTAASVALLDRVIAYWSVILVGAVLSVVTHWRWRRA